MCMPWRDSVYAATPLHVIVRSVKESNVCYECFCNEVADTGSMECGRN